MASPTYDDLVDKLTVQEANIATYSVAVGATPAEIADIAADRDVMGSGLRYCDSNTLPASPTATNIKA